MNDHLNTLFPKNVNSEISDLISDKVELLPAEATISQRYSPKRLREFTTGRVNARHLLERYNIQGYPLLPNADRAPIWPPGIIGSISHCNDRCGVIVTESKHYRSIGFDVENKRDFNYSARKFICTNEEEQWLLTQPESSRSQKLLLIFSIKESLYKCLYQADGIKLGFKNVSAIPDDKTDSFLLNFVANEYKKYNHIKTRFTMSKQHIYTFAHY